MTIWLGNKTNLRPIRKTTMMYSYTYIINGVDKINYISKTKLDYKKEIAREKQNGNSLYIKFNGMVECNE